MTHARWFVGVALIAAATVASAQPTKTKQYTDFFTSTGKLLKHAYAADEVLPDIRQGDSIRAVVRERYASGRTIPMRYTVTWTNGAPAMLRVTTKGARRDTAWFVALDCQCTTPGGVTPTLRQTPRGLAYFVPDLGGNWRPVTPVGGSPD